MALDGSVTIGIEADSSDFENSMGDISSEAERSAGEMESAFQSAIQEIQGFFQGFGEGFSESFAESFAQTQEESAKAADGMSNAKKALEDFKEGLTKKLASTVFDTVVSALKAIEETMKSLITETAAFGDSIDKNSQRLGMTTEEYQEWNYILSQNGANISTLTTSVRTINNRIDEMSKGSATATEAFHRLGISMQDLEGKSGEENLSLIIERLQGMEDETQRNAVANDLLGRSYVDLIPLLNKSAGSVDELRQKAHDTNQLLSEEGIQAAVNYTDAMDTLSKSFEGFKSQIGAEILPGITLVVEGITDLINNVDGAEEKIEQGIDDTFAAIERVVPRVGTVLGRIANAAGKRAPEIIQRILNAIIENSPKVAEGIAQLLPVVVNAIKELLPDIGKAGGAIVSTILTAILDTLADPEITDGLLTAFVRFGYNLCAGIADGIVNYDWAALTNTFLHKMQNILQEADKEFKYFIDSTFFGGQTYGYDKSKVQTSKWFKVYEDGANSVVEYVDVKTDELREAYAEGSQVLDELINGVEETGETTAEVVEETGETIADAQTEAGKAVTEAITEEANALDEALSDLEHKFKTHKITNEEDYWARRLAILNQYRDEEDETWWELYDEVIAPLVLETYGTFPSFWAMVSEEDYPAARRNIFKGKEDAYAGLIEKIDRYDTDVRQHMDELMKGAKEAGVKIAVFAKYGDYLIPPVTENANELSDNTLLLSKASFGATTAKYGSTLPQAVLDKAAANGTDKYISPDKMVDASTCMFPDTTWFFWDCPHETFPDFIFDAMAKFYYADGDMTVFSDPDFPQYQIAHLDPNNSDIGTLEPMNADNAPVIVTEKRNLRTVDWKDMILRLLKAVWAFLFNWLKNR